MGGTEAPVRPAQDFKPKAYVHRCLPTLKNSMFSFQEIAFFDDPSNSVGAMCSRLAADASAVKAVNDPSSCHIISRQLDSIVNNCYFTIYKFPTFISSSSILTNFKMSLARKMS